MDTIKSKHKNSHPLSEEHKAKISAALMGSKSVEWSGRPRNTPYVLLEKVDKKGPDECWPWLGYKNAKGYGRTWIDDKGYYAHRVIYSLAHPGKIQFNAPKDKNEKGFLMHSCDNPTCCNPAHLTLGNYYDNNNDCNKKGRRVFKKGSESPLAKFTAEQTVEILRLYRIERWSSTKIAAKFSANRDGVKSLIYRNRNNARI